MGDGTGAAPGGGGAQVQVKKYVNYALLHLWRGEGWLCFCPEGRVFPLFTLVVDVKVSAFYE